MISGHLHAVWFCVVTWSVILAQTGDLGSPARVMLQFWCFAAVAKHGTPPNRQLNTLFNMPGVYVRSLRMPHLGLPTCNSNQYTTQKKRPTRYKSLDFHQVDSLSWEDAPCTLNIFGGRNATQLVGGNFCLRQQKHAMCLPMAAMANQAMPLRIAWTRVLHSPWQSMSSAFRL